MKEKIMKILIGMTFVLLQISVYSYSREEGALSDIYSRQSSRIQSLINNIDQKLDSLGDRAQSDLSDVSSDDRQSNDLFWQQLAGEQDRYFDNLRRRFLPQDGKIYSRRPPRYQSYTSLLNRYGYGDLASDLSPRIFAKSAVIQSSPKKKNLNKVREQVLKNQLLISAMEKKLGVADPNRYHPPAKAQQVFEKIRSQEAEKNLAAARANQIREQKLTELAQERARLKALRARKDEARREAMRRDQSRTGRVEVIRAQDYSRERVLRPVRAGERVILPEE